MANASIPLEISMALGRIFRMGSRPFQPGDIEDYERCRAIIMDASPVSRDTEHNYARDRMKGAQGD